MVADGEGASANVYRSVGFKVVEHGAVHRSLRRIFINDVHFLSPQPH